MEQTQLQRPNISNMKEALVELGITDKSYRGFVSLLYCNRLISNLQACKILNVPRRVFEDEILPEFGLTAYGNTEEDALRELKHD